MGYRFKNNYTNQHPFTFDTNLISFQYIRSFALLYLTNICLYFSTFNWYIKLETVRTCLQLEVLQHLITDLCLQSLFKHEDLHMNEQVDIN